MEQNIKYFCIKPMSAAQKTKLREYWEKFLLSDWNGHTYNDFVLRYWLQHRDCSIPFYDRKVLISLIDQKAELQFFNMINRRRLNGELDRRKASIHKASIYGNRCVINSYQDRIRNILGGNVT